MTYDVFLLGDDTVKKYDYVHLVGIGGISMSGIAKVLMHNGTKVSGSDTGDGAILDELKDMVYQGDISVKNADVISRTSPEKQQQYIERIKQGEKSSDLVKEIKNEAKKEETERTVISHYNQMTNDLNGKIAVDIEAFKKSLMEDDYDPFGLEGIFEADVALASHDEEYYKKKFDLYDDEIYSDDEKYDKRDKELYERFRVWSNKVLSGECELDEYEKEIVEICIQIADKYEYLI